MKGSKKKGFRSKYDEDFFKHANEIDLATMQRSVLEHELKLKPKSTRQKISSKK